MIDVLLDFDETKLLARLDKLPQELQDRLAEPIAKLTADLLARVQAGEPYRTGALREATQSFVDQREGMIRGRVRVLSEPGSKVNHNAKAGALEYGAHGDIEVSSYSRDGGTVEAYHRDVNIAERRFLRDAAADLRSEFEALIQRAIAEAAKDFE